MTAQARLLGGRYQVGELLGYGGMAEVHRGRDLRLGRDVAIKMLRTDLARDATFQERFRREAQNSAALNHPAIVAVYDTGEEISSTGEKLPFIVMEFVSGHTLKEVLAQEQRIQPRRALEMIADICAALEFSHRHGIIHRDIKPGNVMITQNGQVKVMDFGIARALASGATTMTQTSAVIGTAQYLSPEQARGESVDARSDVYAAGCVLFELLVGHPPFVGDSPVSVAYQHVREDPRAPSDINPEVSPAVDAIVLKALAKNPMNRYQSAQEMRADALRAVAGRPVMATPVMTEAETMAMQGGPQREWHPQAATTMQRTIPGGPPPRAPERRSWVMASLAALGVLVVVVLTVALVMSRNNENKGNNNAGDQPTVVTHEMPDLKNMTEEQARRALQAANLQKIDAGTPTTGEDCDGRVVDQDPAAKTQVPETDTVSYTLCLKPRAGWRGSASRSSSRVSRAPSRWTLSSVWRRRARRSRPAPRSRSSSRTPGWSRCPTWWARTGMSPRRFSSSSASSTSPRTRSSTRRRNRARSPPSNRRPRRTSRRAATSSSRSSSRTRIRVRASRPPTRPRTTAAAAATWSATRSPT
jgi:serine/threonine protein kinase